MPHPNLSSIVAPAIIGGLCGLIGAFLGGILGPVITFRLNDKTRKLDLYKSVFPLKVEAVQKVISLAYEVYHGLGQARIQGLSEQERNARAERKAQYESNWASYQALTDDEKEQLTPYTREQREAWEGLQDRVSNLHRAAEESEWILGIEVRNSVSDFLAAAEDYIKPGSRTNDIEQADSLWFYKFRDMEKVLRHKIHLTELEGAIMVKSKTKNPLSYQREG